MKSQVSGELAVACLKASLCLGIVQNVSWLFLLPLFLLTLPIRLYESLDSTGEPQMLTLLLLSQRQLSPAEWGSRQEGERLWGVWRRTFSELRGKTKGI